MKTAKQLIKNIKTDPDKFLLVALVFALPFERIPSVDVFGASLRLSVVFCILIIMRAAYIVIIKRSDFKIFTIQRLLIFLLVWVVLLIPESINIKRAIAVTLFNGFTIISALAVAVIFNKKYMIPIIKSILLSALLVVAIGIYQYPADLLGISPKYTGLLERYRSPIFSYPRIHSMSLEPLYFASYLLLPISFTLSLIFFDKNKNFKNKTLYILLGIYSFALFLTASRGAIYALAASFVAFIMLSFIVKSLNVRKLLVAACIIVLSFAFALATFSFINQNTFSSVKKDINATKNFTTQITKTSIDSQDERSSSRQKALDILKDNKTAWLVGIGPGQYGPYVQNNTEKSDGGWFIVNNLTLELLVELGMVGLMTVLAIFGMLLFKLFVEINKSNENTILVFGSALLIFIISQAIQYQSFSTLYIIQIWVVVGLSIAVIGQSRRSLTKNN